MRHIVGVACLPWMLFLNESRDLGQFFLPIFKVPLQRFNFYGLQPVCDNSGDWFMFWGGPGKDIFVNSAHFQFEADSPFLNTETIS